MVAGRVQSPIMEQQSHDDEYDEEDSARMHLSSQYSERFEEGGNSH